MAETLSPAERADKVRDGIVRFETMNGRLTELLPPGSIILTPDEQETIRQAIGPEAHWRSVEKALALLGGKT
jgi:hypothetical protein